jgi:hypothetical protein
MRTSTKQQQKQGRKKAPKQLSSQIIYFCHGIFSLEITPATLFLCRRKAGPRETVLVKVHSRV